jgi:hypothetical protein
VANNKFGFKIGTGISAIKHFRKHMMSLLANINLKNLKDNILLKPRFEFFIPPPAKAGGNSRWEAI